MPIHRAYFPTVAAAQTAAPLAVARLQASYLAAAQGVLGSALGAQARAAQTIKRQILGVAPISPGAFSAAAFPGGLPDYVEVTERITDANTGASEVSKTVMPRANVQLPASATAVAQMSYTPAVQATATVTFASALLLTASGGVTVPAGSVWRDPANGRRYTNGSACTIPGTAPYQNLVSVAPVSTAATGETDIGGTLLFEASGGADPRPILNMAATVAALPAPTLPAGAYFQDLTTGRTYTTTSPQTLSGKNSTINISFQSPPGWQGDSIVTPVGRTLTYVPSVYGITGAALPVSMRPTIVVSQTSSATVLGDTAAVPSRVARKPAAYLGETTWPIYAVQSTTVIGDGGSAPVPLIAVVPGSAQNIAIGDSVATRNDVSYAPTVLTVSAAQPSTDTITIAGTAPVLSVVPALDYPISFPGEVFGDALQWDYTITRTSDGRAALDVFTVPYGT